MATRHDPIERVRRLVRRADRAGEPEHGTAMALATSDPAGGVSVRMVLLKGLDQRGFVFYTNFTSRKAAELEANPRAALVLYWASLKRQVRVEGPVARVPASEADAYFASRPRQSQLGAWASRQSQALPSRRELVQRYLRLKARYLGRPVPRPPFWGGYRLSPQRIEIWRSRLGRLHDRILYVRDDQGEWERTLLYP